MSHLDHCHIQKTLLTLIKNKKNFSTTFLEFQLGKLYCSMRDAMKRLFP